MDDRIDYDLVRLNPHLADKPLSDEALEAYMAKLRACAPPDLAEIDARSQPFGPYPEDRTPAIIPWLGGALTFLAVLAAALVFEWVVG
jgi:hypothetical protein